MKLSYKYHTCNIPIWLLRLIKGRMRYVRAAGGIVDDNEGRWLLIQRNGRWDLPKGKVEPGETLAQAALREVEEETGIRATLRPTASPHPEPKNHSSKPTTAPLKTYHIFNLYGGWHLKQTSWFRMEATGGDAKPQEEEGITSAEWVDQAEARRRLSHSYGTMRTLAGTLTVLMVLAFPTAMRAQQPWSLSPTPGTIEQAYLANPPDSLLRELKLKGKIRPMTLYSLYNPQKGRSVMATDSLTLSLTAEQVQRLAPYMVAKAYWDNRFTQLLAWQYLDTGRLSGLVDIEKGDNRYGHFVPIRFLGYEFQPSLEWPVVFTVQTNNHRRQQLTLAALNRLAEWGAFATDHDLMEHEQLMAQQAEDEQSRQRATERTLDSLAALGRQAASLADSIVAELAADSTAAAQQQMRRDVEATKARMDRDQIFVLNIKPAQSDYMFGLEFNLYNCFPKTITKVEITVLPCDANGRVRADKFDRTERTVRCMGPIRPGSPAQYTFDELFWDDSRHITYLRTTSITFHFTDGTVRTFNGYNNILRHSLQ